MTAVVRDDGSSTSEDEAACFEDDTDSFMLRKREFLFSGIPPGKRRSVGVPQGVGVRRECERPGQRRQLHKHTTSV